MSILKTFFSNEVCIQTGHIKGKKNTFTSIFIAILSALLIIISILIKFSFQKGSDFLNKGEKKFNYNFDVASYIFLEKCKEKEIFFNIKEEKENNDKKNYLSTNFKEKFKESNGYNYKDLNVRFIEENKDNEEKFQKNFEDIIEKNKKTTILFGKYHFAFYLSNPKRENKVFLFGDYNHEDLKNKELVDLLLKKENKEETLKQWKNFFDKVYKNQLKKERKKSIFFYIATYIIMIFLSGVIVWLFTFGKNNILHDFSFWDGQKIIYYSTLSPTLFSFFIVSPLIPIFMRNIFIILKMFEKKIMSKEENEIT